MTDVRPPVWIGHVSLSVRDFAGSLGFMAALGMRTVARKDDLAVLELRGGTHLVLRADPEAEPAAAPFDLMVDDLAAQHAALTAAGHAPVPIQRGKIHARFEVEEPSGHRVSFYDSHVAGPV